VAELHWTGYVSVATPIVVVLLGWFLHQKSERGWKATEQRWQEEERLYPDRIEVCNEALEPLGQSPALNNAPWLSPTRRRSVAGPDSGTRLDKPDHVGGQSLIAIRHKSLCDQTLREVPGGKE